MKKIILISLFFLFGCVDKNESSDKQNIKYKGLVGTYIAEKPLDPAVVTLNRDYSFSHYEFRKTGWSEVYGKWSIKNNELCIIIVEDSGELMDERCIPYEILNGKLITYDNPDGSGDILKKIF